MNKILSLNYALLMGYHCGSGDGDLKVTTSLMQKTKNSSTNLRCLIPVRILCSWDRTSQIYVNKCPTRCNYTRFILSANCCTCFGWFLHPSSVAQITVFTAYGTSQPLLLLPVAVVEELRLNSSAIATGSNNNG